MPSKQGDSGYKPSGPSGKSGAYAQSTRKMGGVSSSHVQSWNGYEGGPERGGAIRGGRGEGKSGGKMSDSGSDY